MKHIKHLNLVFVTLMTVASLTVMMYDYLSKFENNSNWSQTSLLVILLTSIACISAIIITALRFADDKNAKKLVSEVLDGKGDKQREVESIPSDEPTLEPNATLQVQQISKQTEEFLIDAQDLHTAFIKSEERLSKELKAIGKRANLNLGIGSVITFIGWGLLLWFVIDVSSQKHTGWNLLNAFIPRFTIVALVEMFSFFFLNLHRESIDRIRYYQNEITNIESRKIAILACLAIDKDNNHKSSIIESLLKVERNVVLKKSETTVDLEKMKIENTTSKQTLSFINELVKNLKGKD